MKHNSPRTKTIAVLAGVAVILLGLTPVSAEPSTTQISDVAIKTQPAESASPIERTFSDPVPLTAEELAYEPPKSELSLPPGAIAHEIKVTAIVPPMRHIIIDATGAITQITSNTPEDIEPKVYESGVKTENLRPMTDDVYRQYRSAVPVGSSAKGVLYERGIPVAAVMELRLNQ